MGTRGLHHALIHPSSPSLHHPFINPRPPPQPPSLNLHSAATYDPARDELDFSGSFDHIGIALIRLFVLVTTENYPDVMMPAYRESNMAFIFFGLFLVIGVFYILPMLLAIVMVRRPAPLCVLQGSVVVRGGEGSA